jgi:hypothetical protein
MLQYLQSSETYNCQNIITIQLQVHENTAFYHCSLCKDFRPQKCDVFEMYYLYEMEIQFCTNEDHKF